MDNIATLLGKIHLPSWLAFQQSQSPLGICSIGFDADHLIFTYIHRVHGHNELAVCARLPFTESTLVEVLTHLVKKHHLQNAKCSLMLPSNKYQVFSLEELPVTTEEFQSAIRWNIKKLISFPIEDAVVDSFPIPPLKINNPKKMISVVVAQASYLMPLVDIIESCGLKMQYINIQEMGFKNITSQLEKDETGSALIHMQEQSSTVIITRQKEFYLSRHLDWGLDFIKQNKEDPTYIDTQLDKLALEVQRTFDYFQTQWRYPAPTRVLLAPTHKVEVAIDDFLSKRLAIETRELDLQAVIPCKHALSLPMQSRCLAVIGGALRREIKNNAKH